MKTFQNKILNPVLGWVAISALVSGCDLTSLRSSLSGDSSRSTTTSATTTTPTLPSFGTGTGTGNGTGTGSETYSGGYGSGDGSGKSSKSGSKKSDDYGSGYGSGTDFGGHSSKKQSQQKTSWSDSNPSYPDQHSYPSWGDDDGWPNQGPLPPHSGPGNSGPGNSGHGQTGDGYGTTPYARTNARNGTHAAAAAAANPSSTTSTSSSTSESTSSASHRTIGESCSGAQGSQGICLAVKYVSYVDGYGDDAESQKDAVRDLEYANQIWRDCGIQFQLEEYQNVQPQNFDLRYRTRNYEELNQIRGTFSDQDKLLVVATGKWDRSGSLGNSWANAWTNLPGERTYGVVLERTVTSYPQILAHELGHYLSLDHKNDIHSLMNPVVARQSVELSRQECKAARWAAQSYWREMMR